MTLQQLYYAMALRQHGSYVKAAQSLGISQPALSVQIRKLEDQTDLQLFDRTRNAIRPTYEGEIFLDRAQLLLTQFSQLKSLAQELHEEFAGDIRLGIIPTLAPYLLPLFISDLNDQYSRLQIHVTEALTEEIVIGIKDGTLDAGIISTPISSKVPLTKTPLFYEEFRLFVSTGHPLFEEQTIAVPDIPLEDLLLLKEGNCFRDQVDNICDIARRQVSNDLFYFESNSIESLCRIVQFKGGLTFLPELTTLHFSIEHEDMIKKLEGPKRVREISIVHLPNNIKTTKLSKLKDVIQQSLPKKYLGKEGKQLIKTNVNL
ncbi:MAG: hydrogen peroxide-inducible genes activator [Bacteroidota bacterium]